MVFICIGMFYYGIILLTLRKTSKEAGVDIVFVGTVIKRKDAELCDKIIKCDRIIIVLYIIAFTLYNVIYFISYQAFGLF